MAEFDEDVFDNFMDPQHEKTYTGSFNVRKRDFPYCKMSNLPEGIIEGRLLPRIPGGCPEIPLLVSTHTCSMALGDAKDPRVECILNTQKKPCYLSEVMTRLAPEMRKLPTAIQEVLKNMDSDKFKCAVFPMLIYAEPSDPEDSKAPWVKTKEEHGALLQVYAKTLYQEISELRAEVKGIDHETKGFYLKIYRGVNNHNKIKKAEDAVREPIRTPELLAKYQKMSVVNAFYKTVLRYDYEQQKEFLAQAWWMKDKQVHALLAQYDNTDDAPWGDEEEEPKKPSIPADDWD